MTGLPDLEGVAVVRAAAWLVGGTLVAGHHASHGATRERPTVLVEVEGPDGTVGWGECPALPRPTYTGEYAGGALAVLGEVVLPALVGTPPREGAPGGTAPWDAVVGHPMATGAVADALLDLALRAEGRSLADALGVSRTEVPVRAVVATPPGDLDALVAAVAARVEDGYRHVGLKVGPRWLEEPVAAVRSAFPDLGLSVDANGTLGRLVDDRWMALDRFGLDEVEQPCRAGDWLGSARVAGCLAAPVCLDESITSWHDVRTARTLGAAGVVNVKPARCGGVARALGVMRYAAQAGLGVVVGGMVESGVGRAAGLVLAGLDLADRPTHLGPSSAYWAEDLTAPLLAAAPGRVEVPHAVGLGRVPDPDRLAARVLDRVEVRAR